MILAKLVLVLQHKIIPDNLFGRRIQYNSPFSRIIFSDYFDRILKAFLTKYKINKSSPQLLKKLESFMITLLQIMEKKVGEAHETYLSEYVLPSTISYWKTTNPKKIY